MVWTWRFGIAGPQVGPTETVKNLRDGHNNSLEHSHSILSQDQLWRQADSLLSEREPLRNNIAIFRLRGGRGGGMLGR
jgi:hypothetical protein